MPKLANDFKEKKPSTKPGAGNSFANSIISNSAGENQSIRRK